MGLAYLLSMTFTLAFSTLEADAPRQRARCSASGRFVAWAKVPQLRAPGAPRVVVIAAPLVAVADGAEVAPVAEAAPVVIADGAPPVVAALVDGARAVAAAAGRWFRRKASALVAGARAALVAGALAVADGAPLVAGAERAASGAPPVEVNGCR